MRVCIETWPPGETEGACYGVFGNPLTIILFWFPTGAQKTSKGGQGSHTTTVGAHRDFPWAPIFLA